MQPQYQMGYDRAITVFSPDGRLYQVEYAREAVKRGTTAVGIKCTDGVVLIVDKRVATRLLEPSSIEKIFKIDEHIGVASSGLVGDARALVDRARIDSQINQISVQRGHRRRDARKEALRPHADLHHVRGRTALRDGPPHRRRLDGVTRLFETDPSGTLLEYKATGIGTGRPAVMKVFEEEYNPDAGCKDAILLGLKALHAATEGKFDVNTVEIGIVEQKTRTFRKMAKEEVASFVEQFEHSGAA